MLCMMSAVGFVVHIFYNAIFKKVSTQCALCLFIHVYVSNSTILSRSCRKIALKFGQKTRTSPNSFPLPFRLLVHLANFDDLRCARKDLSAPRAIGPPTDMASSPLAHQPDVAELCDPNLFRMIWLRIKCFERIAVLVLSKFFLFSNYFFVFYLNIPII